MSELQPLGIRDPERLAALETKYTKPRARTQSMVMQNARQFQRELLSIYIPDMGPEARARAHRTLEHLDAQDMDSRIARAVRGL